MNKSIAKSKHNLGSKQTWIKSEYWPDHSGKVQINYKSRVIFHADERKAKNHLNWLLMTIETTKNELETLLKAYEVLEDEVYSLPKMVKDSND